MTIRVAIADDHPLVVSGIIATLEAAEGCEVVGSWPDGDGLLAEMIAVNPDVLLLDVHMPKKNGLAVLRELHEHAPLLKVVLLTSSVTDDEVMEALHLGVRGILLKEMAPRLLIECIRKVHEGGQWLEKTSIGRIVDRILKREASAQACNQILTRRESEVMQLVIQGHTNDAIAQRLFIATGTVKIHVHAIYKKIGVGSRLELNQYAREKGLM